MLCVHGVSQHQDSTAAAGRTNPIYASYAVPWAGFLLFPALCGGEHRDAGRGRRGEYYAPCSFRKRSTAAKSGTLLAPPTRVVASAPQAQAKRSASARPYPDSVA